MTDRLYYNDPYARKFDAHVRATEHRAGRLVVFLDRSAFYPTSGGQPFDTGTLAGFPVVEVVDEEDGQVAHILAVPDPGSEQGSEQGSDTGSETGSEAGSGGWQKLQQGAAVHGEIDWSRRFDHMQQHTGQHVLSAAFDRLFGVRTVSFHLGSDVSTIDLAREMTPSEIADAEAGANHIVWEDRPVSIRYATKEEAAQLPLRKESMREGALRLIDVDGWDLSACGGTHVARTGAIGVIAVSSWERFKGGQRIEFLCGGRALKRFRSMRETLASSVRLLSVLPEELPASIERLQGEAREQKREAVALQTELARFRAPELAATAESTASGRLVLRAVDGDAGQLKTLAGAVVAAPGFVVVLVSTARPALAVVARSGDVGVSARDLLSALTGKFGGRGGGKPELAQGGGLDGTPADILDYARSQFPRV